MKLKYHIIICLVIIGSHYCHTLSTTSAFYIVMLFTRIRNKHCNDIANCSTKGKPKLQRTGSKQLTYKHVRWTRYHFNWPQWHNWYWKVLERKQSSFKKIRTTEFVKKIFDFLLQQDWHSAINSGNIALRSEKSSTVLGVSDSIPEHNVHPEVSQSDSFSNSGHKSVPGDPIFKEPHEIL